MFLTCHWHTKTCELRTRGQRYRKNNFSPGAVDEHDSLGEGIHQQGGGRGGKDARLGSLGHGRHLNVSYEKWAQA